MHTIPYAAIKTQLYAAQYGQPKPLEDFMINWMFEKIGRLLSPMTVNIDAGDQRQMHLEMRFPQYELRKEWRTHASMGRSVHKDVSLHPREWSRV